MAAAAATASGVDVGVGVSPSAEGSAGGAAAGVPQSSAAVGFSGLWPSAVAVRACWASPRMPAKASLGGGAPRAASGAGLRGPWAALGELSPLVTSHRSVGGGAGRPDRGGRLGPRLVAVLVGVLLDAPDVGLRLRVGRDAAVALHGAGPGVVGRERLGHGAGDGGALLLEVDRG